MGKEQHEDENSQESDNSASTDGPDEDDSEDFHQGKKHSAKIWTPQSNLATRKLAKKSYVHSKYLLGITFGIVFALLYSKCTSFASEDDSSKRLHDKIKSYIQAWQSNYPNQKSETWSTIAGQLMEFGCLGHMSPLVFVMAYNEADKTTKILASEISHAALHLKNGKDECGDTDVCKLSGSDQRIKPGFLLINYVPQVEKCRKMIMYNLEELDGSSAKDLHSLIDPDHPNVQNTVYIFTVKVLNFDGNVYYEVRNTLRSHWSAKIEDDRLNPLLSRLVNNVKIIPEPVFEY